MDGVGAQYRFRWIDGHIPRDILFAMYHVYGKSLSPETVAEINNAVDPASDGEGFEILIPPHSTRVLEKFKSTILAQRPEIQWDDATYVVIRTVTEKGARAAQCYHFDNFRKTAVVVLKSTEGGNNGDLLVRNELRGDPKSIIPYMITKIFWTNPITWFILRNTFIRDTFFTRVPLTAGDILTFDGGTTYHGNLPVTSGSRRSILIHNDPLFKDSFITKLFHKLNKLYLYKK